MKKYILILLSVFSIAFSANAQSKNVTIKVTDAKNKPVVGAIILFDDVKQNRWTNKKGELKTKLKSTPKIISAFHPTIGIKKIKYDGSQKITIKIQKGNDGHLISSSTKDKTLDSSQFNNIYDYLKGNIPGVNVVNHTITIRGYNTVNGSTEPLFILDNNYVDKSTFSGIAPNEIKSVTVLKGPETAVYGLRGANGVIIVKTL